MGRSDLPGLLGMLGPVGGLLTNPATGIQAPLHRARCRACGACCPYSNIPPQHTRPNIPLGIDHSNTPVTEFAGCVAYRSVLRVVIATVRPSI